MPRYLDADELLNRIWYGNVDPIIYRSYAADLVKDSPTIDIAGIGEWIDVSDRLPEAHLSHDIWGRPDRYVTDPVLVTIRSDECDGIRYYVTTDLMMGRTLDTISWLGHGMYGGSAVFGQTIVAWQPLPPPHVCSATEVEDE